MPGTTFVNDRQDHEIGDDLLRLVFVSCHPVLSTEARVVALEISAIVLDERRGHGAGAALELGELARLRRLHDEWPGLCANSADSANRG